MEVKQFITDFLFGTRCAAFAILSFAAAFITGINTESALMVFLSQAALLYLCIRLLRTPYSRSRKTRTLTAFLMYLPVVGLFYLFSQPMPNLILSNVVISDLSLLMICGLPVAIIQIGIASGYAAKQKTHPFIPLVLMYMLYALFQGDAFRMVMKKELTAGSLYYSGYARCGFFELCALAVIHFAAVFLLNRSIKTGSTSRPKLTKGIAAAICLYTVFIALTVLAQLRVYIRACGATAMRTSAMQYAALIGTVFLILFIRQLFRKHPEAAFPAVSAQF